MKKKKIEELFRRFERFAPEPEGELDFINSFTLLVAVVLSAQATDASVNKATEPLFKIADTPQKMLALGEARLKEAIKTIGLFNTKAKNVMALCKLLIERHGGEVPRDREALQALPGVGRKTANVGAQYCIRRADHRGRHASLPGCQSDRPRPRRYAARSRGKAEPPRARLGQRAGPSLADFAWPLCLQGAPAGLSDLHRQRSMRIQSQDASPLEKRAREFTDGR
jgi:hypothetical protein